MPKVAMETVHEICEALVQLVSSNKREGQKSAESENFKKSMVSESPSVVNEKETDCSSTADIFQVERR